VLCKDKPAVSEYVPAGHGAHVAAAEEVAPVWPYLPAAHKEPEHVAAEEEVAPVWPYLPAAHKEPEHIEAAEEVAPVSMYLYI